MAETITKKQVKEYLCHKVDMMNIEMEIMQLDMTNKYLDQPVPKGTFSLKDLVEHNSKVSEFQFKLGYEKGRLDIIKEILKDFNI